MADQQRYCTSCGTVATPERTTKGSFAVEFLLWCLFFFPGYFYARRRLETSHEACPSCGSAAVVQLGAPAASTATASPIAG